MLFRDMTKAQRKRLRQLAARAYERQLGAELAKLEADFAQWKLGKLDAHELSDRIHAFHNGPSRKLYSDHANSDPDFVVAAALLNETLSESEVDAELLELLRDHLAFLRENTSRS